MSATTDPRLITEAAVARTDHVLLLSGWMVSTKVLALTGTLIILPFGQSSGSWEYFGKMFFSHFWFYFGTVTAHLGR